MALTKEQRAEAAAELRGLANKLASEGAKTWASAVAHAATWLEDGPPPAYLKNPAEPTRPQPEAEDGPG